MKKKFKLNTEFYVALIIALICSVALFFIADHEEKVDLACQAIINNQNSVAKTYVDNLWNIDGAGTTHYTVLMAACESGNTEMIRYIIDRGADPNHSPNGMYTPLELYCQSGYLGGHEILDAMFAAGLKQSIYTVKPAIFILAENFFWLKDNNKSIATEIAIRLLQKGAPMGFQNTTLLHAAAKGDMDDLFYTIVHTHEGLSMLNAQDENGDTPWSVAVKNGSTGVQKVIRALEEEYKEEQDNPDDDIWTELIPQTPTEPLDNGTVATTP